MKHTKLIISITILIAIALLVPQVNAITGVNASANGITPQYAVRQGAYKTNSRARDTVEQGAQQLFDISVKIGLKRAKEINLEESTNPNSKTNFLTLKVGVSSMLSIASLNYQLNHRSGTIFTNELTDNQICIVLTILCHQHIF